MKKPNQDTQVHQVWCHFASGKTITCLEARLKYSIPRLPAVICILRKQGHKITSTFILEPDENGIVKRVVRYELVTANPKHKGPQKRIFD